jgi:hypothetical protein
MIKKERNELRMKIDNIKEEGTLFWPPKTGRIRKTSEKRTKQKCKKKKKNGGPTQPTRTSRRQKHRTQR